jgi:hypothetical protein
MKKATQYVKDGVLHVVCPKCKHVSQSTFDELYSFTCPVCGTGSQVKPLEKGLNSPHLSPYDMCQRAIACNGVRDRWQFWHVWQRGIYNL